SLKFHPSVSTHTRRRTVTDVVLGPGSPTSTAARRRRWPDQEPPSPKLGMAPPYEMSTQTSPFDGLEGSVAETVILMPFRVWASTSPSNLSVGTPERASAGMSSNVLSRPDRVLFVRVWASSTPTRVDSTPCT